MQKNKITEKSCGKKKWNTVGNGKELLRKRMNHLKRRNKSRKLSQPTISYFSSDLIPESCSLPVFFFSEWASKHLTLVTEVAQHDLKLSQKNSKIILISELSVLCHTHTVQWLCIVFQNLTVRSNARGKKKTKHIKFLPLV